MLYLYFTNSEFREYIRYIILRLENKSIVRDKIQEEIEKNRQDILDMLKKRVDRLQSAVNLLRPVPQASVVISPLNELLNELKEDYRELSEIFND
jgi:uncharacterized membrane-anchored protein YhcB (DUF1043 family)